MGSLIRRGLPIGLAMLLGLQLLSVSAGAQVPSRGVLGAKNMHAEGNVPTAVGNSIDFFERKLPNGDIKRYAVASNYTTGFDIIDITVADDPEVVGRYVTPGSNYHSWVQVNGPRNIVALSIGDEGGISPAHGMSNGIEFVDISDVTKPTLLGVASGLEGPHTIRMVGPNHVYTTLPTYIIDYSDPRKPRNLGRQTFCGHEFYPDPNVPGRTYVGFCGAVGKWGILDTSDPAKPVIVTEVLDREIQYAHEVYPSPDSSFVGVGDFRGAGQTHTKCPGGGVHFYDISGKYIPGASATSPKKLGVWFAPYTGAMPVDPTSLHPSAPANHASCTLHSFQFQTERPLMTAGLYTGGTWVADVARSTLSSGGLYQEFAGHANQGLGKTTWGNTTGNYIAEGDFVNATQWLPFDIGATGHAPRLVYTNGLVRGVDLLDYAGPLPKKLSRLRVDASAPGGVVTGVLDRYAVLTYEGWVNKPLAGKLVEIRAGGSTLTATTGPDGSFSADLGLAAGAHDVTVSWAGNDEFQPVALTRRVTA